MKTLKKNLASVLDPLGFQEKPLKMIGTEFGLISGWKRASWNSNYGIALIELKKLPPKIDKAFIQRISMITGKALGYRTFLNPIGLQIILVGDGIQSRTIEKEIFVDKVQTFTVLIQNVFLVDTQEKIVEKSETWGQFKVGKYRNAIEKCLKAHVS